MADFEAYWDLKDFHELLIKGRKIGSKYFFLVRDFGIFFYVRDTDFKRHGGHVLSEETQMAKYAKGLNKEVLLKISEKNGEEAYEIEYEKYQNYANKFSKHHICEWFYLSNDLLRQVEKKIKEGFTEIKLTCNTIDFSIETKKRNFELVKNGGRKEYFKNITWEEYQKNYVSMHSLSIIDGGKCEPSTFDPELKFEYVNEKNHLVKLDQFYNEKPLQINTESAKLIISESKKEDQNNWLNLLKKGEYFEDQELFDQAIKYYEEMMSLFPRDHYAWFKRGLARKKNNDIKGALEDYTKSIKLKSDYQTFTNRAVAFLALDDKENAMKDLNEALKLNPDDDFALVNRGYLKVEIKDFSSSIDDFDKAIEIAPENGHYFHYRAFAKYNLDDEEGAKLDYFKAASKGYKQAVNVLHNVFYPNAQSLIDMEDEILSKDPNDTSSLLRRAHLKRRIDPLAAIEDYSKIIEIIPENNEILFSRGSLNRLIGNYEKAFQDLSAYLEIYPESIIGLAEMGFLKLDTNDSSSAITYFQECILHEAQDNSEREYQLGVYDYLNNPPEEN